MIEREVKIRVPDLAALRPMLQTIGATPAGSEQEVNRILDNAEGALRKNRQVLRVRSADKHTLTWKGPAAEQQTQGHKVREELEIQIPAEATDTLLTLLARLGFVEALRYYKVRETWRWQSVTIALDHLDFGDFVEIEGEAGVIEHALHLLHLEDLPLEGRSYPELQREAQQNRNQR